MPSTLRNILAIIIGLVAGSFVNMGLIMLSGSIIPPPEGADITSMEGLTASMHLFEPKHFLFPFLAHALGTFAGACLAALITTSNKIRVVMIISCFFLVGGIVNVLSLPSPLWFSLIDLAGAYIPMGYLGFLLVSKRA
jgi:hypothetical protein